VNSSGGGGGGATAHAARRPAIAARLELPSFVKSSNWEMAAWALLSMRGGRAGASVAIVEDGEASMSCVALRGLTTSLSITQLSRRGGRAETCSSVDGESGSSNIERFIHVISVFSDEIRDEPAHLLILSQMSVGHRPAPGALSAQTVTVLRRSYAAMLPAACRHHLTWRHPGHAAGAARARRRRSRYARSRLVSSRVVSSRERSSHPSGPP
jgi:hypothetical protein